MTIAAVLYPTATWYCGHYYQYERDYGKALHMRTEVPETHRSYIRILDEHLPELSFYIDPRMSKDGKQCHVYLYRQKAFTITISPKIQRIQFMRATLPDQETDGKNDTTEPQRDGDRISIDMSFDPNAYVEKVRRQAAEYRYFVTVDRFGCCDAFVKCSDARACLYPNDYEHLGCYYRENLEAGRIFYGKNRNVD